jgi:hypothetical protein
MVDLALLQSVSYIAGALGVCVAAFYYVMTLRVQQTNMKEAARNSKITFTTNIMQQLYTKEMSRRFIDLIQLDFEDFEEFQKKYDSVLNPESFAERTSYWGVLNMLGYQYKEGLIDLDTLYETSWTQIFMMWVKFAPIIQEYRKSDYGTKTYANFENLAYSLWKLHVKSDPDALKHNVGGFKPELVERAFNLTTP